MSCGVEEIIAVLRNCLAEGRRVEIDGLGVFRPGPGGVRFEPETRPSVFLAYAAEDAAAVDRLHGALAARGFDPWLDRRKLLPGQNWPRAIERAIRRADYFVPCFSRLSAEKRGQFHAELRYALEIALRQPLDGVFLVPVRLDECRVPRRIRDHWQYVDLFPDFEAGVDRIAATLRRRSAA